MKKRLLWIGLVLVLLCALLGCSPRAKVYVKDAINRIFPSVASYQVYYQNNEKIYDKRKLNFVDCDVREIQVGNNKKYLINHSRGFALEFPRDTRFDFTAAQEFITATSKDLSFTVSKEFSPYEGTRAYIEEYLHKFLLNERYLAQNKMTLHKNEIQKIGDYWVQLVALSRTPVPDSPLRLNTYFYCYIYTGTQTYFRILVKAPRYDEEAMEQVYRTLYSFTTNVPVRGVSDVFPDFYPIKNPRWSAETEAFYDELCQSDQVKWGLFIPQAVRDVAIERVQAVEQQLDYSFEGELEYIYFGEDFPVEGMQQAYENGKIVELTLQVATVMNENLDGYNPIFDVLDGLYDDQIRTLARQMKEFGHPFLFRLNNEMNSDWTSYGVSASLQDPQLYVQLWRKLYDTLEEEGVNNAIWVFNPNDMSFPPCGYNDAMAFYPGNEYVHVFGITGYNTGNYFEEVFGEQWREFEEIYDHIDQKFGDTFGKFPWIITEFASSSVGGDKAEWIRNMFRVLPKYPHIKMAFWFSSADYDFREGHLYTVSRPYWLNETEETARAFSESVRSSQTK